jgi:hypothetical protein
MRCITDFIDSSRPEPFQKVIGLKVLGSTLAFPAVQRGLGRDLFAVVFSPFFYIRR